MIGLVCTTISDGRFLHAWERVIRTAGLQDKVQLYIIPDWKTPPCFWKETERLGRAGIRIFAPAMDDQEEFLQKIGSPPGFIPVNSDNRRNIGFLLALEDGMDMIISADDDNLPVNGGYFSEHEAALSTYPAELISSSTGWYNPVDQLAVTPAVPVWPRGYPYFARRPALETTGEIPQFHARRVTINAGLWLGEPDVDAVTRLALSPVTSALSSDPVCLAPGTWMPVNSQNTAVHRDAVPAYYFAPMLGYGGRFGDIFSGYFAQACAKHLGHTIRAGDPLVMQVRNKHDVLDDLAQEVPFLKLAEHLLEWLPGELLEGSTYSEAYESLACKLADTPGIFPAEEALYLARLSWHMRTWLGLCRTVDGG